MRKKVFIVVGVVVGLAVIGYFAYPSISRLLGKGNNQVAYQTATAQLGTISNTVGASGNVRTNQTATISWQTSGKVANVYVEKGQTITEGATLADLSPTSLPQNIIQAQSDLLTAQQNLQDVLDNSTTRASAHVALVQAEQNLQDAQKAVQSKQYQRASQTTIDVAQANLIQAENSLRKAEDIYNANKNRSTSDVQYAAALSSLAKAQQTYYNAYYNVLYVQGMPSELDIEQVNANLEQAQAAYLSAKEEWDRVKDGPDPADVAKAQAAVDSAQATLDEAKLTAPFSGTITAVDIKSGDQIDTGTEAFQIDDMSHLLVDVQVSEIDIVNVKVNQTAEITFDALPNKTYQGVVTDVATTGSSSSGAVNYDVTLEITNPDSDILPGMTAGVNILTLQLNNVLVIPTRAIQTRGTQSYVDVLQNGSAVPVQVTLGASSDTETQITNGLNAGDVVILNTSTTTSTSSSSTTFQRTGGFGGLGGFGGIIGGGGGR
jgi:HlyD family secretion protein